MVMTSFRKHEKSSANVKAALQKERDAQQKKIADRKVKEQKQAEAPRKAEVPRIQELTDEEADKLQKEIDSEKSGAQSSKRGLQNEDNAKGDAEVTKVRRLLQIVFATANALTVSRFKYCLE